MPSRDLFMPLCSLPSAVSTNFTPWCGETMIRLISCPKILLCGTTEARTHNHIIMSSTRYPFDHASWMSTTESFSKSHSRKPSDYEDGLVILGYWDTAWNYEKIITGYKMCILRVLVSITCITHTSIHLDLGCPNSKVCILMSYVGWKQSPNWMTLLHILLDGELLFLKTTT